MTSELRVLHVIEDLGLGGAERLLATMLPLLRDDGIASEVLILGSRSDLAPMLEQGGISVHMGGLSSYRPSLRPVRLVRDRLAQRAFDLVHTHLTYANLYGRTAAMWSGVPVTTSYHNCDYEPSARADNPGFSLWKQRVIQAADRLTVAPARRVIAVSECVKRSVSERLGLARDRVEVIYNGVPREKVEEVPTSERDEARRILGLPTDVRIVVQVGRLIAQKGQLHTIKAAGLLEKRRRDVVWIFVGAGPLRLELERTRDQAGLSERIRFAGSLPDVRPYLRAADLFLFPSLYEGLGIAALEAMAVGLPVVAYDAGPIPEVVVHGETGVLVPTGEHSKLADAIADLLDDRERSRQMGAAGRRRVSDLFLVDRAAKLHAEFYRRLLGPDSSQ